MIHRRRLTPQFRLCMAVMTAFALVRGSARCQEMAGEVVPPPDPVIETVPAPTDPPPAAAPTKMAPSGAGFGNFGMGLGGFGMGGMGPAGPAFAGADYGATWYPSRPVAGANTDIGILRQQLSVSDPVWTSGGDRVMVTASVRNSSFFTDAVLPDSGRPFPSELWNVSLGVNGLHQFANGWTAGGGVNIGSASDKPFHSIDEMTFGFMGFLRIPIWDARDAWMLSLMYAPTGNFNFPIPGVAYLWNPSPEWRVSIGLPFSVMWRPNENWLFNLNYVPITNVTAHANYRAADNIFLFAGFEWNYEAYFLADRELRTDRFIGMEKRLLGGMRCNVSKNAWLDFNAGYAFDREYGIGQNPLSNLSDRVTLAPGAFVGTNLRLRF